MGRKAARRTAPSDKKRDSLERDHVNDVVPGITRTRVEKWPGTALSLAEMTARRRAHRVERTRREEAERAVGGRANALRRRADDRR